MPNDATQLPADLQHKLQQLKQAFEAGVIDEATFAASTQALIASPNPLLPTKTSAKGRNSKAAAERAVIAQRARDINTGTQIKFITVYIRPLVASETQRKQASLTLHSYLRKLQDDLTILPLDFGRAAMEPGRRPLQLKDVYVDLNTTTQMAASAKTLAKHFAARADASNDRKARDTVAVAQRNEIAHGNSRAVGVIEALCHHRTLTLVGKPGSGKSTLGKHLALHLAAAVMGDAEALKALGPAWTLGKLLPVRIELRAFSEWLSQKRIHDANGGHLWAYLKASLAESSVLPGAADLIQTLAHEQGALFVLDGLDECGSAQQRDRVRAAVMHFRQGLSLCAFLITARPYAFKRAEGDELNLEPANGEYQLADLTSPQIAQFSQRWFEAVREAGWNLSEAEADEKRRNLIEAAQGRFEQIARIPLLLTMMAKLLGSHKRLPDDRVELYDEVVDLLLDTWNERTGQKEALLKALAVPGLNSMRQIREPLEKLAYEAHERNAGLAAGQEGQANITSGQLSHAFERLAGSKDKAGLIVSYIEERAGLLTCLGEHNGELHFTFWHRTFQEYLAACYVQRQPEFGKHCTALAEGNLEHWQEALVLAARIGGVSNASNIAHQLIGRAGCRGTPKPNPVQWGKAFLAARQLREVSAASARSEDVKVLDDVRSWLYAAMREAKLPARQRAEAGDLLAELTLTTPDEMARLHAKNDPMPAVLSVDYMQWCGVPAGQFYMGSSDADSEKPAQPTFLLEYDYAISRYPITNAQYEAFVQADGYRDKAWWGVAIADGRWQDGKVLRTDLYLDAHNKVAARDESADRPVDFGAPYNLSNHPAVGISWYEMVAFCEWLTARWHTAGWLTADQRVQLPNEPEWEKAARGGDRWPTGQAKLLRPDQLKHPAKQTWKVANPKPCRFTWGDKADPNRANYDDTKLNTTNAVGCFASGASPYGCEEMLGNVMEWTRSGWGPWSLKDGNYNAELKFKYPYAAGDGREAMDASAQMARVLRGGAFYFNQRFARCAYRHDTQPDLRDSIVGFRIVVSPFFFV